MKKIQKMSKEEALKFFTGVELSFVEYYKYVFTYRGKKEGQKIIVKFGGDSSSIYRMDMYPTETFYDAGFVNFKVDEFGEGYIYTFSEF